MSDGGTNRNPWQWNTKREAAALGFAEGKEWAVIAQEVDVSISTLGEWRKKPEFQARIEEHIQAFVSEARDILRRHAAHAARRMVTASQSAGSHHSVQVAAAKDILDRVGLKAPEKLEHTHKFKPEDAAQLADEELDEELKKRGLL